jgi:hypothetical protein
MIILLGLLLMLAAAAACVAVAATTGAPVHVEAFNWSAGNHSVGAIFALGAVAGLVFALGLMLAQDGGRRWRKRRAMLKVSAREQLAETQAETQALRERNAALESRLASSQAGSGSGRHRSAEAPSSSAPRAYASTGGRDS